MENQIQTNNTQQAFWVGISQLSSFFISIISVSILSRVFDKTEYGTYRQIMYIYNTLLALFSAGLYSAYSYFLPKQTIEQRKDFVIKLLKLFSLLGLCFSLALFLLAPIISSLFRNPNLLQSLRYFSVVPMLLLPTIGIEGIYATIRKTYIIAIYTTISRIFLLLAITLPVFLFNGDYITAVYGWIISSFLICVISIYLILNPFKNITRLVTPFDYKKIFNYSLPLMTATIFGIIIRFADQFFISRYYGIETFAEFSNGFIDLPFVTMIVGANSTVLLPLFSKYSELISGKELIAKTWKSSIEKSAFLIFPLLSFFIFNSRNTMVTLYGPLYLESSKYFIIGILLGFFNVIVFNPVLFALGKTRIYSNIHLIQATLIWLTGFLIIHYSINSITYAIVSRILFIGQVCAGIYFSAKAINVKLNDVIPFNILIKTIFHSSIICFLINSITNTLVLTPFVSLIVSGVFSAIIIIITGKFLNLPYYATFKMTIENVPILNNFFKRISFNHF